MSLDYIRKKYGSDREDKEFALDPQKTTEPASNQIGLLV